MAPDLAGNSPSTHSPIYFLYLILWWIRSQVHNLVLFAQTILANLRAWLRVIVMSPLGLYLTGVPILLCCWMFQPKIWSLKLMAKINGRSYIIHPPHALPILINRNPYVVHTFPLTTADIKFIYGRISTHIQTYMERCWRPRWWVDNQLTRVQQRNPPMAREQLDLTHHQLDGPRLTQGQGLIGRGFTIALIQEYRRHPDIPGTIVGHMYSWTKDRTILGNIPISFVTQAGVSEMVEYGEFEVTFTWAELAKGMEHGLDLMACPSALAQADADEFCLLTELV